MITVGAAQPSYLTVDPTTGVVGASFSGHVHAAGLDLDAGTTATPPTEDRIRWLRTTDGALVAEHVCYSQSGLELFAIQAHTPAQADTSQMQLIAEDDLNAIRAQITIAQSNRGTTASVTASSGGTTKVLVREDKAASYLQTFNPIPSSFWSGAVTGAGAIRLGGTSSWFVTRTAAGTYTLQLVNGVPGVWAIAVGQINEGGGSQPAIDFDYISQAGGTTTYTVKTISDPFGLADLNWSFAAIATAN